MLLVNGRFAPRARFPAQGKLEHRSEFNVRWLGTWGGGWERKPTDDELTTLRVDASILGKHFEPANAELTLFHEWDESVVGVRSCDTDAGVIRFSNAAGHAPGAWGNRSFVVWNTRDGITEPGQWMFDRLRNRILYWPLPGEDAARLSVVIPTTEAILRLEGGVTRPIRDITIRGLAFSVTDTPLKTGGFGAYAFEGAITGEHLQDCLFSDLGIRQVGGNGIKLTHARGCRLEACDIGNMGATGVLCQEGADLEIANNRIHHVGLTYPSGLGLTCTGTSNRVAGNFVHDTTYVGITCDGFSARIESNRIERVMLELHDGAGIYLGGTNHVIRGNVCRDIGRSTTDRRHAYYMDELMRGSLLEGNLAIQCPSPLHNHIASDNDIVNNVFLHDGDVRLSFFRCDTHRLENNLVAAKGTIEIYRPEAVSHWSNNLFFSRAGVVTGRPVKHYDPGKPFPFRNAGVLAGEDPGVRDNDEGQASWAGSSPAARVGIRPLDLRSSGSNAGRRKTANTDWFSQAKYGVFMHFLPCGKTGLQQVEQFDVKALAGQLEEMSAGYLVLTLGQNSGFMNSPNAAYEKRTGYAPGERCSTRDRPLELYKALQPKGIRLMLYLPCQVPNEDARAQKAFGLPQGAKDQPLDPAFAEKWSEVIQEWSDRYGDKVAGWWFDGGYEHIAFNDAIADRYAAAVKHGNPKAIVTFNPGVKVIRWTKAEDYTAGELNEPLDVIPDGRWLEGSQWHALTYMGGNWGTRNTRFTDDQWVKWAQKVTDQQGVITMDMGPNHDATKGPVGSLAKAQVNQVKAIRAALRPGASATGPK